MKYVIAIGKGVLMFVVSAIIIGTFLTLNWNLNMLNAKIEGVNYRFSESKIDITPRKEDLITRTVFVSEAGDKVMVELTDNFYYDPCDAYTVTIMPASGDSRVFTYTPDQDIKRRINSANANLPQPVIPDFAIQKTFYYGKRDITGFITGAAVSDTLTGSSDVLPASAAGNTVVPREVLGLSDDTYYVLDSITAFRNYLPFKKAIEPIVVWTPAFVFGEYVILGIINLSRDIYIKVRKKHEKEDFPARRTEEPRQP